MKKEKLIKEVLNDIYNKIINSNIDILAYLLGFRGLDKYFFYATHYSRKLLKSRIVEFYNCNCTRLKDTTAFDGNRQLISTNFFRQLKATANFDIILQISQFDSIFRHFLTNFDIFRADSTAFFDFFRLFSTIFFRQHFSTYFDSFFRQISTNFADSEVWFCRTLSIAVDVGCCRCRFFPIVGCCRVELVYSFSVE